MSTTLTLDQILAANKAAITEAQELTANAFASFEKLVGLNLAVAKSALLETSGDVISALGSAQNPSEALAAQATLVKPLAEKSLAYGRSVYAIAAETTAEFSKVAEGKLAEGQKAFVSALDAAAKNAPAGSESVVAAIKSAVVAGNNAMETAKSSAKKAVEMAEKQVSAAADTAINTVKAAPRKK